MTISVRPAELADVPGLARVHVESWRETYRGQFSDEILDDPTFIERREQFWTNVLTSKRISANGRVAAAVLDGEIVGVALAAPFDGDPAWDQYLWALYTYESIHEQGAGSALLAAVIDFDRPAALYVADPNPRARTFYRKHGFQPDGTFKVEDGVREIRMTRTPAATKH
ncbi:GNAT family N-acetyltransferase [Gryllotalpicola reticulitermitis]|uniref:GNAT family N-acetyltransferase n=1 Tax=Gryllotalpicola reticulitermitis TaxID=1184153 RepID=A0ABV8Q1G9_9MICO